MAMAIYNDMTNKHLEHQEDMNQEQLQKEIDIDYNARYR